MTLFFTALIAGLTVGSIYVIVGIGYTVVFNATRVFNLAQGDLLMVGVMLSYYILVVLKWGQVASFFLVIAGAMVVALFEERTVVRSFLKKQGAASFGWFIATLGFSLIVQTVVLVLFGRHPIVAIPSPFSIGGFHAGQVVIGYRQMFVIISFAVVIGFIELFYQRTWIGQAMRATSEDREAASLLGVNPVTVSRAAFALGGFVAGFAGFAIAPITFSNPAIGLNFTLKGFLALAIGGFGSVRGAVIGGLLIGVGEQMWSLYFGAKYDVLAGIVLLLLVLTVRPSGLFKSLSARNV